MKMKKEELIAKMAARNYHQIFSEEDYVMRFLHENGMSYANYQKRSFDEDEEVWEPCF